MERQRSRIYLPEEDVTPVANDPKTGEPKEARFFAQYFKKQTPDMQIRCGYVCVEQHNVDPNYVVSWITEDWAREQFRVW